MKKGEVGAVSVGRGRTVKVIRVWEGNMYLFINWVILGRRYSSEFVSWRGREIVV